MAASVNADTDTTFAKEVLLAKYKKKTRMLNQFLLLTNVAQSEFVVDQPQDLLTVSAIRTYYQHPLFRASLHV